MKLLKFLLSNKIILLLLITVLLSYGQILLMNVWQDDNALFFKLAYVNDRAGYLGYGIFGEGAYKYTATPYIPLHFLFGYHTEYYFALALIFYFVATFVVYRIFASIISKDAGLVASFIYACGYVASDGFIRLFNTVITSLSIILIALFLYSLWNFKSKSKKVWYLVSILFFFLAIEFARARTHYLIAIPIIFELLYFNLKAVKSYIKSVVRIIPFFAIFYFYFVQNADSRSGEVTNFFRDILNGQLYKTFSFVSTISNLFIPDWIIVFLHKVEIKLITLGVPFFPLIESVITLTFVACIYFIRKNNKRVTALFLIISCLWFFLSRKIFDVPQLPQDLITNSKVYLGGIVPFFFLLIFKEINKKYRKLYLLLLIWSFVNIGAYSAYFPTVAYETVNRYLAHSFWALAGIFAIIFVSSKSRLARTLIIFWGIGNLVNSIIYQNNIVKNRSSPPRAFYSSLMGYLPKIEKGAILYFDVDESRRQNFADAFSVAQMPETTAIAWRYGVDRYDFDMATEFADLLSIITEKNIDFDKVYSFYYSKQGLEDTSKYVRDVLENKINNKKQRVNLVSKSNLTAVGNKTALAKQSISIAPINISTLTPLKIILNISAKPLSKVDFSTFPIYFGEGIISSLDKQQKKLATSYNQFILDLRQNSEVITTSSWQDRVSNNLIDGDTNTVWQPDRILWHDSKESLTLKLNKPIKIAGVVWQNGFGNNTPTNYVISVSQDNLNWYEVASVNEAKRIDNPQPQVIKFEPVTATFVKVTFKKSLNDDSPGISEIWVLPAEYSALNMNEASKYINNPLSIIESYDEYITTINNMNMQGKARIYWKTNKFLNAQTNDVLVFPVKFDNIDHDYSFILPAGGTILSELTIVSEQIPGILELNTVQINPEINR